MRDRELFELEIARLIPGSYAETSDAAVVTGAAIPGTTLYLPLALNKTVGKKVGAFVPPAASSASAVDVIVYFHGHAISACGTNTKRFVDGGMSYYWNTPLFQCLRRDLATSGRTAILLAPAMHPFVGRDKGAAGYGDLNLNGKFDELVNTALSLLTEQGALRRGAAIGNVILAGHSGGGQPMQKILAASNSLKPKIREAWGFESLYFRTANLRAWLKSDPTVRFRHFRRDKWKDKVIESFGSYPNFIDTAGARDHCRSVEDFWGKAIALQSRSAGPTRNFEFELGRANTPSPTFTLSTIVLHPTAVKIVRSGSEDSWKKYTKRLKTDPKAKAPAFVQIQQPPAESLTAIVRDAQALARKAKKLDLVPLLDPDTWFSRLTQITFLGRSIKNNRYIHVELAKSLKKIEQDLIAEVGGNLTAKAVGDILLNKSKEGISGTRDFSATAALSMHMFGLAVDVNYLGNPFIDSDADIDAINQVLRNASSLLRNRDVIYGQLKPKKKLTSSNRYTRVATSYDALQEIDTLLEEYFALADNASSLRSRLVAAANTTKWRGLSESAARVEIEKDLDYLSTMLERTRTVNPKTKVVTDNRDYFKLHAILDFDKRFVDGMVRGGLTWGAWYGDLMHFDMRVTGVGKFIEDARKAYLKKARTQLDAFIAAKDYGYHAYVD